MAKKELEHLYEQIKKATELLQSNLHTGMIDALIEVGDDIHDRDVQQEDGLPDDATAKKLKAIIDEIDLTKFEPEEIRQVLQVEMVFAAEFDKLEPNQQITPEAVATLTSFMILTITPNLEDPYQLADIAAGSGNLLYAVQNQLEQEGGVNVHVYAVDNDENMLGLASMSAALTGADVDLYHQDAIDPLPFNDVNAVVADLPVGYYPIDERAKNFATAADKGHSYAHHLLMEQALRVLKPGGLGLFFVPSAVFKSEESKGLTEWIAKNAYFQGLLGMPEAFFSTPDAAKSLLVLQKPGADAKQAPQVLLAQFPDVNDHAAFQKFVIDVRNWHRQNLED